MSGAHTPEELEMLLEDAFVIRDLAALVRLFEEDAVLASVLGEARGGPEIARLAAAIWERDYCYGAAPRRVVQAHDTALVVARQGTSVVRRRDGGWRYAISLLEPDPTEGGL